MELNVIIDLFSGLGGASEAFLDRGWKVIRVENNPLLKDIPFTVQADALEIAENPQSLFNPYTDQDLFIWASPPCLDFSNGFNGPKAEAKRAGELYVPDMSLLRATCQIINYYQPKYWAIENVVGSIEFFRPCLGEPRFISPPYVLWGNFPSFTFKADKGEKAKKDVWSSDPLRANKKAVIPYGLSQAMLQAVESQTSLDGCWCGDCNGFRYRCESE